MDGILVINKKENMTSRDVVNIVCKKLKTKKVGHTGTLDPMATGVLVLGVGKALKIVDEITAYDKEYIAEITLGISTDTLDITGKIIEENSNYNIKKTELEKILESFVGEYNMEVPKYSAIKVNGKKLYEYARNNIDVELPIKKVYIYKINLIDYNTETGKIKFKCHVSKGTYIRSLIKDICKRLNVLGTMSSLVRIKQGTFDIDRALDLDNVDENTNLISIESALTLPKIEIDEKLYNKVKNGCKLYNNYKYDKFCFTYNNNVVAIYIVSDDKKVVKPKKVFS